MPFSSGVFCRAARSAALRIATVLPALLWLTLCAACDAPTAFERKNPLDVGGVRYAPAAPEEVTLRFEHERFLRISWKDVSEAEDGYVVERRVDGGAFDEVARVGPNTQTAIDTARAFGTYEYCVRGAYEGRGGACGVSNPLLVSHFVPGRERNYEAQEDDHAVKLRDGRVMVFSAETAEVYDPATSRWTALIPPPEARRVDAALVLPDGRVLSFGVKPGAATRLYVSVIEAYDPDSGAWAVVGGLAESLQGIWQIEAALLPNGTVLMTGRSTSYAEDNFARVFDPSTGGVRSVDALWPTSSLYHDSYSLTPLSDGRVLGINPAVAGIFDPEAETWRQIASLPGFPYGHATASLGDGQVLVLSEYGQLHAFNPLSNASTKLPLPLKTSRLLARLSDDAVFVGFYSDYPGNDKAYVYEAAEARFQSVGPHFKRHSRGLRLPVLLDDGRLLLMEERSKETVLFRPRSELIPNP